jgi:hypothetical protein
MKIARLLVLVVLAVLAIAPAAAADDKGEMTFAFNYVKPETGGSTFAGSLEYGFPVGPFLFGPAVSLIDAPGYDSTLAGGLAEINLGSDEIAVFFGARALYDLDAPEDVEDVQWTARAGIKLFVGDRGLVRFEANKVVDGFGESSDINVSVGAGLRF